MKAFIRLFWVVTTILYTIMAGVTCMLLIIPCTIIYIITGYKLLSKYNIMLDNGLMWILNKLDTNG